MKSESKDQSESKAQGTEARASVQADMQHIETQLNKFGLSIGHLLREVARRFHGVEVPPVGEELEAPEPALVNVSESESESESVASDSTSNSVKEIKV